MLPFVRAEEAMSRSYVRTVNVVTQRVGGEVEATGVISVVDRSTNLVNVSIILTVSL